MTPILAKNMFCFFNVITLTSQSHLNTVPLLFMDYSSQSDNINLNKRPIHKFSKQLTTVE